MFHSPWMYFETGYSCAPHFKTFAGFVCFFHFESVLKLGSHVHLTSKHSIGSVLDSMSSFDIYVSSGGMGGSLNHFCWGILVFDPPRCHSHPNCTLSLVLGFFIQPLETFTPKLCWKKIIFLRRPISELSQGDTLISTSSGMDVVCFNVTRCLRFRRGI